MRLQQVPLHTHLQHHPLSRLTAERCCCHAGLSMNDGWMDVYTIVFQ